MASPTKARGLRSLSGVPSCQRRFDIETSVDVVQPAGSYSFSYTVGLLFATTGEGGEPAIEIISTAATGPARYRLPDPFPGFTELALPLLRIPEVRFSVQTFIPQGLARTRALIVVELLRDTLSNPVGLRKLYAAACSKRCKQREEERRSRRAQECRPEGEQQPERPKVELVPELEGKVIGMLSWKDRLISARLVCKSWKQAADAITPPTSYTARVHQQCYGRSATVAAKHRVGFASQGTPPGNPSPSPSATPSQPLSASTKPSSSGTHVSEGDQSPAGGRSGGGASPSPSPSPLDRDILPSVEWLQEQRFKKFSGEEAVGLLDDGVRSLDRMARDQEGEELCRVAANGDDGLEFDVDAEGEARIQCRRIRSLLAGVRALCAEHGISCGAGEPQESGRNRAAAGNVVRVRPPFGLTTTEEVVAAVSAAAARAAESDNRPSTSSLPSNGGGVGGGGSRDNRWDGWLVFALAVTLASSEDRPFLCRCALQPVWGRAGLPRTQMIELLSKAYVALRPDEKVEKQASTTTAGFQAAAGVSVPDDGWDGTGSYRLRNDLLQCIYALENYFVRFVRTHERTEDGDVGLTQSFNTSQMAAHGSKLMDLSTLTNEQRMVANTRVEKGQTLKVVAYAGTGKTVTLRAFAQMHPEFKILYVAFNKRVAENARDVFPRNTQCHTMHSVAMRGYSWTLRDNIKPEVYAFLKEQDSTTPYAHAMIVHRTIVKFCQSSAPKISMKHVWIPPPTPPSPYKTGSRSRRPIKPPTERWVLQRGLEVWERMHPSPENARRSDGRGGGGRLMPKTFDSILKVYQLSSPDLSPDFDVIMLDEAQDINECQADIISRQTKCRVIVVGDPHQAIYDWRGAKDYLKQAKCFKTLRLTQCFRFGPAIASVGNTVLLQLKRERRPLLGSLEYSDGPAKVLFEQDRSEWFQLDSERRGRFAFIARTNAGLIKEAILSIARGDRVAIEGGNLDLKDVRDVCYMMLGDFARVKNPELREMGSIRMLNRVLEDTDDQEIKAVGMKLNMVQELLQRSNRTVHDILADVNKVAKMKLATDSPGPLMILTTVHKAKGLEYDTVVLADDFSFEPLVGGRRDLRGSGENANLLYVAVTRAKRQVILNEKLALQLRAFGMWDSLALQGTSSDQSLRLPLAVPCHGYGCQCADARGVATDPALAGGSDGEGGGERVSQAPRLIYAGSGSVKPLCRACAEGVAGEEGNRGVFPYALKLSTPRGTI